jgi:uncharacterized membrane protein (DUF106 family)
MVAFLNPFFDVVLGWLLIIPPFWAIAILSFAIALIIVIITKLTTDQDLMKHLKEESKVLQKQMKELKDHPDKMLVVQKQHMEMSMKMMRQSFRPMIFTLIPLLLIFGWMQARLAYEPIMPEQEFSVKIMLEKGLGNTIVNATTPEGIVLTSPESKEVSDGIVIFTFKALREGLFDAPGITFNVNGKAYVQNLLVTKERKYSQPIQQVKDKTVKNIETVHEKTKVLNLGVFSLSWFWSYLILSILFSSLLRKIMKVY